MRSLSRLRLSREILPVAALRLTPMVAAISRQERPAAKPPFRSSSRSSVQVCASMCRVQWDPFGIVLAPETVEHAPRIRVAIVTDGKQPVLDREPDAFLDQRPGDAGNAGAVGALSHKFLEIGNGRKRQSDGNAVCLGF